jgi:signal transduction histidine kinase
MPPDPIDPAASAAPRSHLSASMLRRATIVVVPAIFALRLTYFLFQDLADGVAGHVGDRVFQEATGALLAVIPLAIVFWLARRVPLARPLRRGTVAAYALCFVLGTLLHTTAMIAVRAALGPAFGFDGYDMTFAASRFVYEAANDLVFFIAIVALLALAETLLGQRDRERRAAALERSLLRAELSNLRLQLQPHFLFNALNTISSTMYEDVEAADALLGGLAELLRASLRTTHAQETPLREELGVLGQYLALVRARFGERIDVTIDAGEDVLDLAVPSMVLQPLVENAVRHGGLSRVGRGRIAVTAAREGASLVLRVHDDGPPAAASDAAIDVASGTGTGLSTTAKRLRLLYDDAQSMRAGPSREGGFAVELRIPARTVSPAGGRLASAASAAPSADEARRVAARC